MHRLPHSSGLSLILLLVVSAWPASAQDRPSDKILADLRAVELPKIPEDRSDRSTLQQYLVTRRKAEETRAALIGELFKSHPEAPELPRLIAERWQLAMIPGPKAEEIKAEMEGVLARGKDDKLVA